MLVVLLLSPLGRDSGRMRDRPGFCRWQETTWLRTLDNPLVGTVSLHSYSCIYGIEPDLKVAALCAQPVSYPIKLSA